MKGVWDYDPKELEKTESGKILLLAMDLDKVKDLVFQNASPS